MAKKQAKKQEKKQKFPKTLLITDRSNSSSPIDEYFVGQTDHDGLYDGESVAVYELVEVKTLKVTTSLE